MKKPLIGVLGVVVTFILSSLLDYLMEQYPGLPDFPHRNEILLGCGSLVMIILIALQINENRNSNTSLPEGSLHDNPNNDGKLSISYISTDPSIASEVGADYTPLKKMLSKEDFKAADKETARIMLWVARREKEGYLREEDIEKFPCRDLRTIDQLWLASSGGKFGFSVQKQIWIECGGKLGQYNEKTMAKFYEYLGWKVGDEWVFYNNLCWDKRAPKGHLPRAWILPKGINGRKERIHIYKRAATCKLIQV